jgi:hypothetical protein
MAKVGVKDLESFYPFKDRQELSMALNNLLAAPAFASWMEGEPLDIQQILHTPEGKPRVSIFSIAHLNDAQRMFFVSLLLNQTLGWMRTQSGTNSLRAILYMDEIFGYFPPTANPPSKLPLLTLLKQGRAFGLGVVLVTQNPVDLDYKGLSNAGTWFIGRLQTERDKARMLEGLEGIAGGTGMKFDRGEMEQTIAGLGNRIFLMNNVHEDGAEVFETRWDMSYLRGPLTRTQIKSLMEPVKRTTGFAPQTTAAPSVTAPAANVVASPAPSANPRPSLPPEISQYFIPVRGGASAGAKLVYHPALFGIADIGYSDSKKIDMSQQVSFMTAMTDGPIAVDWEQATAVDMPALDLESTPEADAQFGALPPAAAKSKSYDAWQKELATWLYRNQKLELMESATLEIASNPGESERDFRVRLQQFAREQRDEKAEKLRQKYAPKIAALEEKARRAQQAVDREAEQAKSQKMQTAISFGATLLSSFMGRKAVSLTTLGRATSAARGVGRSMKEAQDVGRAEETVAAVNEQMAALDAQFKAETEALEKAIDPQTEALETISLKPKKSNIAIKLFTLAWAPYWHDGQGQATPAWE